MANHLGANQLPITVDEKLNNTVLPKKKNGCSLKK